MNPWELGITILGWIFFACCAFGALILVFGAFYGIAKMCGAKWALDADERNKK